MCGIMGFASNDSGETLSRQQVSGLVKNAMRRGVDSSGLIVKSPPSNYRVLRADFGLDKLVRNSGLEQSNFFAGHSRLVTNGMHHNQPAVFDETFVIHNGIVLNAPRIWDILEMEPKTDLDSEVIAAYASKHVESVGTLKGCWEGLQDLIVGAASCVLVNPRLGECLLFSNTGSLHLGLLGGGIVFASEASTLRELCALNIRPVGDEELVNIGSGFIDPIQDKKVERRNLVPRVTDVSNERALLELVTPDFQRCSKCILPETMPFINFDEDGVCNYCLNYVPKRTVGTLEDLRELVEPFRRRSGPEVIVPFSGGRDSTWALKLIVEDLGLRAVTFTYDWGMVTDLGRRNISLMTSKLGVENIVVAADIATKRRNIQQNLGAWLRKPHLGMVSLLTAGDKHFYRFLEDLKPRLSISLNLWGVNPWETTHFKAGFLGVRPDFLETTVYKSGMSGQLSYHSKRFREMLRNPSYLNASIYDTLSGEYFRSIKRKRDYFHVFDYVRWDEATVNSYLESVGWEKAEDTVTTWRIGDGTAGFYNYIYRTVAGFSEHDTFRSNQIREGVITRDQALNLVSVENSPRYENIKWYLSAIGLDFAQTVMTINRIPKLYSASHS